jgi:hypothetical protein
MNNDEGISTRKDVIEISKAGEDGLNTSTRMRQVRLAMVLAVLTAAKIRIGEIMSIRNIIAIVASSIILAVFNPGTASATCLNAGTNNTIGIRSCNWNVTVWRRAAPARFGHFKAWNFYNPRQYKNSPNKRWFPQGFPNSNRWNMGAPWSNVTCAQFYRKVNNRWVPEGKNQCNHDS